MNITDSETIGLDSTTADIDVMPTAAVGDILSDRYRLDEAEQRLETTLEATRRFDMSHWEAMALKVRGQLHTARGDEERARRDFDKAIEIFEKLESRLELARALVLRGGEIDLDRARDLLETCGATGGLAIL